MIDRELEFPEERRLKLRTGVNLGEVIVEPHDIFGNGVNMAARLEALAEPAGICVSRTVHDDEVRNRLPYLFDDVGERSVKNIARPLDRATRHVGELETPHFLAPARQDEELIVEAAGRAASASSRLFAIPRRYR